MAEYTTMYKFYVKIYISNLLITLSQKDPRIFIWAPKRWLFGETFCPESVTGLHRVTGHRLGSASDLRLRQCGFSSTFVCSLWFVQSSPCEFGNQVMQMKFLVWSNSQDSAEAEKMRIVQNPLNNSICDHDPLLCTFFCSLKDSLCCRHFYDIHCSGSQASSGAS